MKAAESAEISSMLTFIGFIGYASPWTQCTNGRSIIKIVLVYDTRPISISQVWLMDGHNNCCLFISRKTFPYNWVFYKIGSYVEHIWEIFSICEWTRPYHLIWSQRMQSRLQWRMGFKTDGNLLSWQNCIHLSQCLSVSTSLFLGKSGGFFLLV